MSLLDTIGRSARLATAAILGGPGTYTMESGTDVAQVQGDPVAAAAFGINLASDVVDRTTAMTIPAVRRGRQVIAGTIGALPLIGHRTNPDGAVVDVTAERSLLTQPDPNVTRAYLLTWLVDDLLFYGVAWWWVDDFDPEGFPRRVHRLRRDQVSVDVQAGTVYVNGAQVTETRRLIRFDGPDEGVLMYGGRTLRTCLLLEEAVRKFARLDVPLGLLQLQEGAPELTQTEVQDLLDEWEAARRERTTAYLNRAIGYTPLQFDAERTQLDAARQYQAAEVARLLNLAPRWVNAPNASGMTYATTESDRRDLTDTSLVGYLEAITQRLSMGDVTPRGTVVRFDLSGLLRGDTKDALEAAKLAVDLQAMTPDEVRSGVLGRPPLTPDQRASIPAPPPAVPTTPGS